MLGLKKKKEQLMEYLGRNPILGKTNKTPRSRQGRVIYTTSAQELDYLVTQVKRPCPLASYPSAPFPRLHTVKFLGSIKNPSGNTLSNTLSIVHVQNGVCQDRTAPKGNRLGCFSGVWASKIPWKDRQTRAPNATSPRRQPPRRADTQRRRNPWQGRRQCPATGWAPGHEPPPAPVHRARSRPSPVRPGGDLTRAKSARRHCGPRSGSSGSARRTDRSGDGAPGAGQRAAPTPRPAAPRP